MGNEKKAVQFALELRQGEAVVARQYSWGFSPLTPGFQFNKVSIERFPLASENLTKIKGKKIYIAGNLKADPKVWKVSCASI